MESRIQGPQTVSSAAAAASVRQLGHPDLEAVARIHLAAFPASVLTALGGEATRRYYEWQLLGAHDLAALGAFAEGRLLGFCFGGVFHGALSGFLERNRAFLACRILTHPWLLANPRIRDRLAFTRRLLRRSPKAREWRPKDRSFGILAIAVDPGHQGAGVGQLLMQRSETIARERAFPRMYLVVSPENTQAIRFYERLGWQRAPGDAGVWTGGMTKDLP